MSITRYNPNTVFLGGDRTQIGDLAASETITPGMLVERFNNAGVVRFRKHPTAGGNTALLLATEQSMLNKGVDDTYAANDLMEVSALHKGATAWVLIASGQNLVPGNKLESAGDGTFRILASGTALMSAIEAKVAAFTGFTRLRAEAI